MIEVPINYDCGYYAGRRDCDLYFSDCQMPKLQRIMMMTEDLDDYIDGYHDGYYGNPYAWSYAKTDAKKIAEEIPLSARSNMVIINSWGIFKFNGRQP